MRIRNPRTATTALLILLLAGVLAGCGGNEQPQAATPATVTGLSLVPVTEKPVPDFVEAVGTVRAARTSQLSSQLLANIIEMRATEGTRVRRGETLVILDDAQPRAAMERHQAALQAAEQELLAVEADHELALATLNRYRQLLEKRSVSPQEYDEVAARARAATARQEMARAGVDQARAALIHADTLFEYTRIRAPYDGLVTEKHADPGTLATPGTPLLVVEDTRRFRLEVGVNETDIGLIHLQDAVPVIIEALGREGLPGRVVQIVPAADPGSRSFLVKVELPAREDIRSGLFGRALFSRGERLGRLIPVTAVVTRGQLQAVYVVGGDDVLSLRYLTLDKPVGDTVEVLSGLEPGELIVANPGDRDLAGKHVEGNRP